MFSSHLLNSTGFFLGIEKWYIDANDSTRPLFEDFLFRATSAIMNAFRMEALERFCIRQFKMWEYKLKLDGGNEIAFWSPVLMELIQEFSPYLSSIRVMQNEVLHLIKRSTGNTIDIPSSLYDAIKKGNVYKIDPEIWAKIVDYWHVNGAEVREYRDIDHHFFALSQGALLQLRPNPKLLIYLPDNPKERNRKKVTFDKRREALPFFRGAMLHMNQLMDDIGRIMGYKPHTYIQPMSLADYQFIGCPNPIMSSTSRGTSE